MLLLFFTNSLRTWAEVFWPCAGGSDLVSVWFMKKTICIEVDGEDGLLYGSVGGV